jgi:hypothetical protein
MPTIFNIISVVEINIATHRGEDLMQNTKKLDLLTYRALLLPLPH